MSESQQALDTIRLPSIETAFAEARLHLINAWEAETRTDEREKLWYQLKVLGNVKTLLYAKAVAAQTAQAREGTA